MSWSNVCQPSVIAGCDPNNIYYTHQRVPINHQPCHGPTLNQPNVIEHNTYDGVEEHSYHMQASNELMRENAPGNSQLLEISQPNYVNPLFWSRPATLLLINKFMKHRVGQEAGQYRKKQMWEKIQKEMMTEGYPFSSEQISGRWKTLMRGYRQGKEGKGKKYDYQDELDSLFAVNPPLQSETIYVPDKGDESVNNPEASSVAEAKDNDATYQGDVNPLFWNKEATLALIKEFRKYKEEQETKQYTMKHLWEKIEHAIMLQGYPYNAEQISGRWKTLMRGYKASKMYDPSCGKKYKKYEFYDELNALYDSDDFQSAETGQKQSVTKDDDGNATPVTRKRKRRKLRSQKDDLDYDDASTQDVSSSPLFWNKNASLMLIAELKSYSSEELGLSRKKRMWLDIQTKMKAEGYPFNADQICGRWKTLLRGYRSAKSANFSKKYEFQEEMEDLLSTDSCVLSDLVRNSKGDDSDSFDDDDVCSSRHKQHSCCREMIELFKQFTEDQKRREREDIARQERMHRERICVMQNFIQSVTPNVTLKPADFM